MREQNATDHGESLEDIGDAGEHEVEIPNCVAFFWEEPWALNYLLLPVLCAASEVLTKVLNQVNKDKNCCTFFFSR